MNNYTHEDLNKRICDLHPEAENTQTLLEFVRESEVEFCMEPVNLEELSQEELNLHIDFLDELWFK